MKIVLLIAEIVLSIILFPLFFLLAIVLGLVKVYKAFHHGFVEAYFKTQEDF